MTEPLGRVAVIGLGAVGSMALWRLARRGADVVGFDAALPGHDGAAYGGGTRMLRPGHQSRGTNSLLDRSVALWRELEQDSGESLVQETGSLTVGPADNDEIAALLGNLRSNGTKHAQWGPLAARAQFPQHRFEDCDTVAWSPLGLVVRSNLAVATAVRTARLLGAEIRLQRVAKGSASDGGAIVETVEGIDRFDHTVLTAGPWAGDLIPGFAGVIVPRAVLSTWFKPRAGFSSSPGDFPIGVRRTASGQGFSFFPGLDDDLAKINVWNPHRPRIVSSHQEPLPVDAATVDVAVRLVTRALPGLNPEPCVARTYPEGFTPDRLPVVGLLNPAQSVLGGFSGSGFGMAPLWGDIAADLAIHGATRQAIEHVRIDRLRFVK